MHNAINANIGKKDHYSTTSNIAYVNRNIKGISDFTGTNKTTPMINMMNTLYYKNY